MKHNIALFTFIAFIFTFTAACKKEKKANNPGTQMGETSTIFIKFTEGDKNVVLTDNIGNSNFVVGYKVVAGATNTLFTYGCGMQKIEQNANNDYYSYALNYGQISSDDFNDFDEFNAALFPLGNKPLIENTSVLEPNYFFTFRENSTEYSSKATSNNFVEITSVTDLGIVKFPDGMKKAVQISGTISELSLYEIDNNDFVKDGKTKSLKNISFSFKAGSYNTKL